MLEPSRSPRAEDRRDTVETTSRGWAVFGLAMLVLIGLIAAWSLREVNISDARVNHTNEVIEASRKLTAQVDHAKISTQEYVAKGDERFEQRYHQAAASAQESLKDVRRLTADSASQQKRLNELAPLVTSELKDLASMIALRSKGVADEADVDSLNMREESELDRIHDLGQQIEDEEYQLLQQRSSERRAQLGRGLAATVSAALLALLSLVLATIQVSRAVKQRDVADRDKQESESIANSLFEAAPQGIVIVDQNGMIVMANPETEKLFGYLPEELSGKSLGALIPERLQNVHTDHRDQFFSNPRNRPTGRDLNLKARRKDGTEFDAEISLGYFKTAKETLAVAFVSDISKRRTDERAIHEQQRELRQLAGKLITAQDDERRRIARNLHDDLSQTLAAIAMDAGRLASKYHSQEIAADLRWVQQHAAEAAEQVRQISHQLHPSILDDLGLKVALEEYCTEFESRSGIVTYFTAENMPDRLPSDISDCVYHIAGESLRNVSKHSRGGAVFVNVGVTGNVLHLSVRDNGVGFSHAGAEVRHGIGIVTMKERARLVGGTVSIHADIAQGTTVSVEVPVNAA
jgi:PAS domain S-box-containing protein